MRAHAERVIHALSALGSRLSATAKSREPRAHSRELITLAAALAGTIAAAGCVSERPTAASNGPQTSVGTCRIAVGSTVVGGVQAVVAIKDFKFFPDTIRVPRGTTLTWVNCEELFVDEPHTSTSDGQRWGSELLLPTDIYSRRFDEPGDFPYHCEPHPFMKATVIVQ